MTDSKTPQQPNESDKIAPTEPEQHAAEQLSTPVSKSKSKNSSKPVEDESTTPVKKTAMKTGSTTTAAPAKKRSATAIIALLLAMISAGGVATVYYLHTIENAQQSDALLKQVNSSARQNMQQLQQLVEQQQTRIEQRIETATAQIQQQSEARIEQLAQQIARFEQNQPSDWLLHEAEYLTRIASRSLWLEHDTHGAINLLLDADSRIKELNDPQYLPIRQLIREDIAALKLMPALATEDVILNVLALSKQIPQLNFAMVKVPESSQAQDDLQLSESTDDWRQNLAKTWRKFLADFITVRRRTGNVEPLMAPDHQQHLKENLALKLQQLQWAASQENAALYRQYLEEIQLWLNEYFDLGHLETAKFYQAIHSLKDKIISYDYSVKLLSHQAIRQMLNQSKTPAIIDQAVDDVKDVKPESAAEPSKDNEPLPKAVTPAVKDSANTSEDV